MISPSQKPIPKLPGWHSSVLGKTRLARPVICATLAALVTLVTEVPSQAATTYTASWASVDKHNPAPTWFQDAKFGIYFHWGVFSTPAYYNEWYPREMYEAGQAANSHHISVYGDPVTVFPYHYFINGGYNKAGNFVQFAPKLKSNGGNFDPNEWAQLFSDAGAQFAGPVAEHHDGFSMWNSTLNEWNSVAKGPKMDLLSLFATAIRAKNLKLMVAMHHAYNFTGYYQYAPHQTDTSLQKLYGQLSSTAENQLWYDKLKEVIDNYQPDMIWEDFNLSAVNETQRLNFLSYYYNKAIDWNKEVVATYKDGYDNKGEVYDYERGGPADIVTPYWLTDDCVSGFTWCYTSNIHYYSTVAMLHSLIDHVSKNGNLLLNIAPQADGTIPQGQKDILLGIGGWLKPFGECIYGTRAWSVFGEGPTKMGGGSFTTPTQGTNTDIRFTRSGDNTVLYAIVLGWPGNGATLKIKTLNSTNIDLTTLTGVSLLSPTGSPIPLVASQDSTGLNVTMPAAQPYTALAYAYKLTFSGYVPSPGSGIIPDGVYQINSKLNGLSVDVNANSKSDGAKVIEWPYSGSTNEQWQFTDLGNDVYSIIAQNSGKALEVSGSSTANNAVLDQSTYTGATNQQWHVVVNGAGGMALVNQNSGKALDIPGHRSDYQNIVQLIQYAPSNQTSQSWLLTPP